MIIGFTGTQNGMTDRQKEALFAYLAQQKVKYGAREFHHGDCVGADAEADEIARKLGYEIHVHPPKNPIKRAFKSGILYPEKDYLERNHDIVNCSDHMVATPFTTYEQIRSGTWSTYRYARKRTKAIAVIDPQGHVHVYEGHTVAHFRFDVIPSKKG